MSSASFVHAMITSRTGKEFTALVTPKGSKYIITITCHKVFNDLVGARLGSAGEWNESSKSFNIKGQPSTLNSAVVLARQSLARIDRLRPEATYVWKLGSKELTIVDVGTRHAVQISHAALRPSNSAWGKLTKLLQDARLLSADVYFENNAFEAPLTQSATRNIDATLQKLVDLCAKAF